MPAPDGTRIYVSNEADTTLDVFDRASGGLVKKVALSNRPNNIAATKEGDHPGRHRARGGRSTSSTPRRSRTKSILVKGACTTST